MATYYVRADGTASAVNAVGPRTSASDCMSLSTCNGSSYSPGDVVYICDDGGIYRGTLNPASDGTGAGGYISYVGLGSPHITGADIISGWSDEGSNVWSASVTTEPEQVWMDEEYGDRQRSSALSNEFDWWWTSNTLYIYSPSDPDSRYTTVESGARAYAIEANDRSYLIFDNLRASKGEDRSIISYNPSHITIRNCIIEWGWLDGFVTGSTGSYSGILVEDNIFRYNGVQGSSINCGGDGHTMSDIIVRRNVVIESGVHQLGPGTPYFDVQHTWPGGIKFWCSTAGAYGENIQVYDNEVYDCGNGSAGVWFDRVGNDGENPNYVYNNYLHDNSGPGIFIEVADHVYSYSNVIYNSSNYRGTGGAWSTCFIRVHTRYQPPTTSLTSNNNLFYNNVCYADSGSAPRWGVAIMATDGTAGSAYGVELVDNVFKNNIIVGWTDCAIYADYGGDNDGTMGSGNTFWYNCFGPEDTNFMYWSDTSYSTYDAWEADENVITDSGTTHSIEEDPGLEDPDNDKFWLASDSPCIGAAVNLGSPYNTGLLSETAWPDGVVTDDRDDY